MNEETGIYIRGQTPVITADLCFPSDGDFLLPRSDCLLPSYQSTAVSQHILMVITKETIVE